MLAKRIIYSPYLLIILTIYLLNFYFFFSNGNSWIFNFNILDKFGDQRLYIELSSHLINHNFVPHVYSVGFPLFLIPFLIILKTTNWVIISFYLVIIYAFVIMPTIWILILSLFYSTLKKTKRKFFYFIPFLALIIYELIILKGSKDPLTFYLFFGLTPYSEPFAILILIILYYILLTQSKKTIPLIFYLLWGVLAAFAVSIRIVFIILIIPILVLGVIFLLKKKIKKTACLATGLLVGYLPQLLYNYKTYHKIFYISYNWYWEKTKSQFEPIIKSVYGDNTVISQFSINYLKSNVSKLIKHYIHFVLFAIFNVVLIIRKRKTFANLSRLDVIFLASNISVILYIILYLSYWWSPYVDCIDRFLLPLVFFSLVNLSYSIILLNENPHPKKI